MTLFDQSGRTPAEQAGDDAIYQAALGADRLWLALAEQVVLDVAARGVEFTADDVWDRLDTEADGQPREPRALGVVMRRLARQGTIRRTGYQSSRRVDRHAGSVAVWRSTLAAAATGAWAEGAWCSYCDGSGIIPDPYDNAKPCPVCSPAP